MSVMTIDEKLHVINQNKLKNKNSFHTQATVAIVLKKDRLFHIGAW